MGHRLSQFRLAIVNLDDCVLDRNRVIGRGALSALRELGRQGLGIVFSTRESLPWLRSFWASTNLPLAGAICHGGGLVANPGGILLRRSVNLQAAYEVLKVAGAQHLTVFYPSWSGHTLVRARDDFVTRWEREGGRQAANAQLVGKERLLAEFVDLSGPPLLELMGHAQALLAARTILFQRYGRFLRCRSLNAEHMLVLPAEAHTKDSAGLLLGHLNTPREALLAFGDPQVDAELLDWAGKGIDAGRKDARGASRFSEAVLELLRSSL